MQNSNSSLPPPVRREMAHWTSRRFPSFLISIQSKLEFICVYLFALFIVLKNGVSLDFLPYLCLCFLHKYGFHPFMKISVGNHYSYEDVEVVGRLLRTIVDLVYASYAIYEFPVVGSCISLMLVISLSSSIAKDIHLNSQELNKIEEERMQLTNYISIAQREGHLKSRTLSSVCQILNIELDDASEYLDSEEDLTIMKNHVHTFYELLGWQISNNPTRLIYRSTNCSICQMEESEDTIMCYGFFPCGHICVCKDCYDSVYDQQGGENSFCPVCQAPVYKLSKLENRDLVFFDESFFPTSIDKDDRCVSLEDDGEGNSFILLQNKSL